MVHQRKIHSQIVLELVLDQYLSPIFSIGEIGQNPFVV
jgi:hypothetical protein